MRSTTRWPRGFLHFERSAHLQATQPAELRGLQRDEVRLLVSGPDGHQHSHFHHPADVLQTGDLLNRLREWSLAGQTTLEYRKTQPIAARYRRDHQS